MKNKEERECGIKLKLTSSTLTFSELDVNDLKSILFSLVYDIKNGVIDYRRAKDLLDIINVFIEEVISNTGMSAKYRNLNKMTLKGVEKWVKKKREKH